MFSVNKVILIGNLGEDPKVRHWEDKTRATFSLATDEVYKKDNEKVINTDWHNIVLWGKLAEIAEKHLSKGRKVYIEGKLSNNSYKDKDGNLKCSTEVVGKNILILSPIKTGEFVNENNEIAEECCESNTDLLF